MTSIAPRDCWSLRRGRVHIYVKDGGNPCCDHVPADVAHSMCIPMLGLGETCGILSLYTAETVEKSEENWAVAGMIAERLAPALANLKLQESLRAESVRDRLTGLFNRRYLDESLEREMSRARRHKLPVSVMMLDIDHFKQYNDAYGHDGGDIVLRSFGNLLVHNIRGEDFACRYGGEEFTLVLPGAAHDFALRRAEEIRAAVQRLRAGSGRAATAKITTSIGVATVPEHGDTTEKILLAADAALYLAKNSGRNRVVGAKVLDPAELYSNLESPLYQ
jgi:diguanylate cyclase (GGDEF)-like protein